MGAATVAFGRTTGRRAARDSEGKRKERGHDVRVASLVAALDRVAELGGTCTADPTRVKGVGTVAHVRDPAGNVIGLLRMDERTT